MPEVTILMRPWYLVFLKLFNALLKDFTTLHGCRYALYSHTSFFPFLNRGSAATTLLAYVQFIAQLYLQYLCLRRETTF